MSDKEEDFKKRLEEWNKTRFSPPPEKPTQPTKPTFAKMVELRDGVRLYTEVFLPSKPSMDLLDSEGAFPAVLSRSPYPFSLPSHNDKRCIKRYLTSGYAVVFQLTRGQGASEGRFRFLLDDINDGYDAVEWIASQPWCDGNVGMEGSSYVGNTQLLAARAKPPALKCIMPTAFLGNVNWGFPFSYGVLNKGPFMQWCQIADAKRWDDTDVAYCDMNALNHPKWGEAFRKRPVVDAANQVVFGDKLDCWRETVSHPKNNGYWAPIHFTDDQLLDLDLPMFFTDGWYDMTIGPIEYFTRLQALRPNHKDLYLEVGPWDHYQTYSTSQAGDDNGDRVLPANAAIDLVEKRLAFFDRYLKNDTDVSIQENRVRVYISGSPASRVNKWFNFPTFPAPGTIEKKLFLHSKGDARSSPGDGILDWEKPASNSSYQAIYEPYDRYVYDPEVPTAFQVETFEDRRHTEIRSDVLTYTSAPMEEPLVILGDIQLYLFAATDAPDTDWFAVLTEVCPKGSSRSFHYAPPAFRARYRSGLDKEVMLSPNKPELYHFPLGPAGHQISTGNRLRLSIFSSAFPEYEPNTNTGNPAATDTEIRTAVQTVFHNIDMASHVVLPTIKL